MSVSSQLTGVFVTFELGAAFDAARLTQLAQAAAPKFRDIPGLLSKTFTVDASRKQAVNFYVWRTEDDARRFFSAETLAWVTDVYGVAPALHFVPVVARVENPI
jgi:hypothetical protein